MEHLTLRQQQVLDFILSYSERAGMPPTRAEIASHMGFRSANAAEDHLRALQKKGAISLAPGASRGIRVHAGGNVLRSLPVVGRVAAGAPILATEHVSDHLPVEPGAFRPPADYLLRVTGASMCDAGILDGDLLAVHRSTSPANGQIVVARVDDEVTVKRFRKRGKLVQLLPENKEFDTIDINLEQQELVIEGIGVGVIRAGLALR